MKEYICKLPLFLKIFLAKIKNCFDYRKLYAIKKIDQCNDLNFVNLNTKVYKKNLKNYLLSNFFDSEQTYSYIQWLYNDQLEKISEGVFDDKLPTIICVVKNEYEKLINFFLHYKSIGEFNYIFIDNLSTDKTVELLKENKCQIYLSKEKFSTNRKLAWINKVYSTLPNNTWTILLDADEILVYYDYEKIKINQIIEKFNNNDICSAAAVMIDMFSNKEVEKNYLEEYKFFENVFHEEKSYYFNSIYGGIREREFKIGKDRIFLIKKHPFLKKCDNTMLIHCHYNYPFKNNIRAKTYFGLLHYKIFDSEIEKYKKIAKEGIYGNNSIEYKTYISALGKKTYQEIFKEDENTEVYSGTNSLKKIQCLRDVGELK